MTEEEFRAFASGHYLSKDFVEDMLAGTSADYFLQGYAQAGKDITVEQAEKLASLLRKQIATSIALYENGVASKEEVLEHRIEKLPPDIFS